MAYNKNAQGITNLTQVFGDSFPIFWIVFEVEWISTLAQLTKRARLEFHLSTASKLSLLSMCDVMCRGHRLYICNEIWLRFFRLLTVRNFRKRVDRKKRWFCDCHINGERWEWFRTYWTFPIYWKRFLISKSFGNPPKIVNNWQFLFVGYWNSSEKGSNCWLPTVLNSIHV